MADSDVFKDMENDSGNGGKNKWADPSDKSNTDSNNNNIDLLNKLYFGESSKQQVLKGLSGYESFDTDSFNLSLENDYKISLNGYESSRESISLENRFDIPAWGIKQYYNERAAFQKGLYTMLGEPAWFYFKIFFRFDTSYGLFGSVLGNEPYKIANSALVYLLRNQNSYLQEKILNRVSALKKFTNSLSYISTYAPWMFTAIKDLDKSLEYDFNKLGENKSISIETLQETIDLRLSSIFDLYRYVAFDFAHSKEILPENLRKFDMDIVIFQTPLRFYQTSMKDMLGRKVKFKNLYDNDIYNRMSFHLFTLQNCEFDIKSFSSLIPNSITNDKGFEMKPTIKINYDKCYHHSLNEFLQVLVGDDGYNSFDGNNEYKPFDDKNPTSWSDDYDGSSLRRQILKYRNDNPTFYNQFSNTYKALVEASEDKITNAMRVISPKSVLGNLYKINNSFSIDQFLDLDSYKNQIDSWKNNFKNTFKW